MKIRRLERSDYSEVRQLLRLFSQEAPVNSIRTQTYDNEHADQVLLRCEKGGISLVAEDKGQCQGCLISLCVPDLWQPRTLWLREIAWYVKQEYRGTSMGARLFMAYKKEAEKDLKAGRFAGYTMSKLSNSDDFDYEKRGMRFCEGTYLREA